MKTSSNMWTNLTQIQLDSYNHDLRDKILSTMTSYYLYLHSFHIHYMFQNESYIFDTGELGDPDAKGSVN